METHNIEVMVGLDHAPDDRQLDEIELRIKNLSGVSDVRAAERTHRLLLVDYDPTVMPAQQILGAVRGGGFEARLIGF